MCWHSEEKEHNMISWEAFELDCTNYLNNKFGKYATFIHQGGSDSTVCTGQAFL